MNFLEKDLEEIIFTADRKSLQNKGLYIGEKDKLKRQLKVGNYGIADLVSYQKPYYNPFLKRTFKGKITVFELKKDKISMSSFLQAMSYLKGIRSFLEKRGLDNSYNYSIKLVGKEIDLISSFCYLPDFINADCYETDIDLTSVFNVEFYLYKYDINGISFNEVSGYSLTAEGF